MAIDHFKREKRWRLLYTRSNKLHRARQLGIDYPRRPLTFSAEADVREPDTMNVLFVCSKNRWRSPTAEKTYARRNGISARSRGTSNRAQRTVQADDLKWADVVFVMENRHREILKSRFPGEMAYADVYVLNIPDDYQFMDPELVECLRDAVDPVLEERS